MGGIVLILMAISMVGGNGTDKKSENREIKMKNYLLFLLVFQLLLVRDYLTIIIFKHQAQKCNGFIFNFISFLFLML